MSGEHDNQGLKSESIKNYPVIMAATRPEIIDFWGRGGPSGPKTHPKRSGAKPPSFSDGFLGRRGRPDHPKSTISGLVPANDMSEIIPN